MFPHHYQGTCNVKQHTQLIDCKSGNYSFLKRVLHRSAIKEGILPDQLVLRGVQKLGRYPVAAGSYADIWKGTFKGGLVALKVHRRFGLPEDQRAFIGVSTSAACRELVSLIRSRNSAMRHWFGDR